MTQRERSDLSASVRQRLLNRARQRHEDFQWLLTQYGLERLMYRIGNSKYKDDLVLKGALLFALWGGTRHRRTKDLDLHGSGMSSVSDVEQAFRDICVLNVEGDGLEFLEDSVHGAEIRQRDQYLGVRVKLTARLAGARIPIQVDVGFGDVLSPQPEVQDFPIILEFPAPHLRAYRRETVVAEKFEALVTLGMANSRLKDYFDLWRLAQEYTFEGKILCKAIEATFSQRRITLPGVRPVGLTPAFFEEAGKVAQWRAFLMKGKIEDAEESLAEIVGVIADFIMPSARAAAAGGRFEKTWPPGGPWG